MVMTLDMKLLLDLPEIRSVRKYFFIDSHLFIYIWDSDWTLNPIVQLRVGESLWNSSCNVSTKFILSVKLWKCIIVGVLVSVQLSLVRMAYIWALYCRIFIDHLWQSADLHPGSTFR